MKKSFVIFIMASLSLFFASSLHAGADFGMDISEHVLSEQNVYNEESQSQFNHNDTQNVIVLSPYVEYAFGKRWSTYILADLTWTRSFESGPDDLDPDLTNAFIHYGGDMTDVYAGLQMFSIGRGFIHKDNEPGLSVDVNLNDKTSLGFKGAAVSDKSGLYSVNIAYRPDIFQKIELFGSCFTDNNNTVANLLGGTIQTKKILTTGYNQYTIQGSSGNLYYIGAGADVFLFDCYARMTAILETGSLTLTGFQSTSLLLPETVSRDVSVSSYFADLDISRNVSKTINMAGFFTLRSGGRDNTSKTSNVYVTPMPMLYRTLVFDTDQFGPYLNQHYNSAGNPLYYSRGIIVPGLCAPGIRIECRPVEKLTFKLLSALLYPQNSPDDQRTFYGWEWDLSMSWKLRKNWEFYTQGGCFYHGNFFKDEQGLTPTPASKVIVGINVSL